MIERTSEDKVAGCRVPKSEAIGSGAKALYKAEEKLMAAFREVVTQRQKLMEPGADYWKDAWPQALWDFMEAGGPGIKELRAVIAEAIRRAP